MSLDEQIAVLEESRAQLVARKAVAEQKIAELDARIRARRAKEMEEKEKVAAADREAVGKR